MFRNEKWQFDINRETKKMSALSSGKIDKYEYPTAEKILPSNQRQIIEQVQLEDSSFGKAFKAQIEKQFRDFKPLDLSNKKYEAKQTEGIFPKNILNALIINKLKEIVTLQDIINTNDL